MVYMLWLNICPLMSSDKLHYFRKTFYNILISAFGMWDQTECTILNSSVSVSEISSALISQSVQGTVAKKTVKILWISTAVTRVILALTICKKSMIVSLICHSKLFLLCLLSLMVPVSDHVGAGRLIQRGNPHHLVGFFPIIQRIQAFSLRIGENRRISAFFCDTA